MIAFALQKMGNSSYCSIRIISLADGKFHQRKPRHPGAPDLWDPNRMYVNTANEYFEL